MKKYLLIGVIIIVVGGGAYYFIHKTRVSAESPASSGVKSFALVVKDRKLVSGETTLTVKKGDSVSITITANESDELHLHGYDMHTDFATDTPATISFTANQSGRFPFEMEGSKTDLGELVVLP